MTSALEITRRGPDRPERHDSFTFTIVHPVDKKLVYGILLLLRKRIYDAHFATIQNLYDIARPKSQNQDLVECHLHWGWTSLRTATIVTSADGFHLSLPPALLIDDGTKR